MVSFVEDQALRCPSVEVSNKQQLYSKAAEQLATAFVPYNWTAFFGHQGGTVQALLSTAPQCTRDWVPRQEVAGEVITEHEDWDTDGEAANVWSELPVEARMRPGRQRCRSLRQASNPETQWRARKAG
jgi:hypothetical protein